MSQILLCTNPILRQVAEPVLFDKSLNPLLKSMIESMNSASGVGLAAPQIGVSKRVVVVQLPEEAPQVFINPEIHWFSEEKTIFKEGCLSIPDFFEDVERPEAIKLSYYLENGEKVALEADKFLARVLQHEIDHLNGKLYIDYLHPLKKERILKKIKKLEQQSWSNFKSQ